MSRSASYFLLTALLIVSCDWYDCPELVETDFSMQFVLYGGIAGNRRTLNVHQDGKVEAFSRFHHPTSGRRIDMVVDESLSSHQKKQWANRLNEAGFFCLDDCYPPTIAIKDGWHYELTVTSGSETKSVIADDRCGGPEELCALFWEIHDDLYTPVYTESATVGTIFKRATYEIKPWPFGHAAPLVMGREYYFADFDSSGDVKTYLDSLAVTLSGNEREVQYLHSDAGQAYRLTSSYEGFKINQLILLETWPVGMGISIGDIGEMGVVVRDEQFDQVRGLFDSKSYSDKVFILNETGCSDCAYHLLLVNGEVVEMVGEEN